jgi:hypothetical protein
MGGGAHSTIQMKNRAKSKPAGSCMFCVPRFYHGCPIAYSLGNLVFDGASTVASWNRGALLEVGLNEDAKISSVSLIPVILEDGLPHVEVTESNRFGSR